jgi:nicotinamide-nucleotide amidase
MRGPRVGYHPPVNARADDSTTPRDSRDSQDSRDTERLADDVDGQQLVGAAVHAELVRRKATLATAESLTGGALGDLISASPGASETYLGGMVTYATEVKTRVLGVRQATVEEYGVVSAECAREMAERVRDLIGTVWGVSTTGVAGPTEQEGKPVGTVFVAVAGPDGTQHRQLDLDGDRAEIRQKACVSAAKLVLEALVDEPA